MKVIIADSDFYDQIDEFSVYIATDGNISDDQDKTIRDRIMEKIRLAVENGYR